MTFSTDIPTPSGFKSIKSAFRRRSVASNSSSGGSPPGSTVATSTSPSSPLSGFKPNSVTGSAGSSFGSSLASKNYPHVHVKEMVYECCTRIPKHSYEETVRDCKCGKKAVDRYREICGLKDAECPGCKFGFEDREESDDDDYYY